MIDDLLKCASDPGTPNDQKEESTKFYSMEKEIKSENLSEHKNESDIKENDLADGILENIMNNKSEDMNLNNNAKSTSFSLKGKLLEFNDNEPEEVNEKKRKMQNNSLVRKLKRIK